MMSGYMKEHGWQEWNQRDKLGEYSRHLLPLNCLPPESSDPPKRGHTRQCQSPS